MEGATLSWKGNGKLVFTISPCPVAHQHQKNWGRVLYHQLRQCGTAQCFILEDSGNPCQPASNRGSRLSQDHKGEGFAL